MGTADRRPGGDRIPDLDHGDGADGGPRSLLVLGGGYVALEQAQLFARLGSQVTLLVRSRLASKEEPEVSKALQEVFADEGIRVVSRAVPTGSLAAREARPS